MNNKGFTLMELLIAIAIGIFVLSVIIVPTQLVKDYKTYSELSEYTTELFHIKSSVVKDLESMEIKESEDGILNIGDSHYEFTEKGLYRHRLNGSIQLSKNEFNYEILEAEIGSTLRIHSDKVDFHYAINNVSFNKRGNLNE